MKKLIIFSAILVLSGCGKVDRMVASMTGSASTSCEGGVLYYQFTSGAAVAYNTDGTVKLCK